jgi:hypothetical protein
MQVPSLIRRSAWTSWERSAEGARRHEADLDHGAALPEQYPAAVQSGLMEPAGACGESLRRRDKLETYGARHQPISHGPVIPHRRPMANRNRTQSSSSSSESPWARTRRPTQLLRASGAYRSAYPGN